MLEDHYNSMEESYSLQEHAWHKDHPAPAKEANTPEQQHRSGIPAWLKRLITRRTRMIQPFQLSGKDENW